MATFIDSKFNADTDPSRPKIGEELDVGGVKYRVMEVGWSLTSALVKEMLDGLKDSVIMNPRGYDYCFCNSHPTRPGVQWIIWVNKI